MTASPKRFKMEEAEQKMTGMLVFSVMVAVTGNSFLFGYNNGVVNTPIHIIQAFYNQTYYERNGGNWSNVVRYELDRKMYAESVDAEVHEETYENENELSDLGSPEEYGVEMDKLLDKWQLKILWSTTVAVFVLFGLIGALSSGRVADHFGRKKGMILITFIMFVAAILGGISRATSSPELLMASRMLGGFHSGLNTSLCPVYLAEISPRRIRGAIGACHQLAITVGILISQVLGLRELLGTERLWPWLFAFNAFPALACLLLLPLCPPSPRFLLIKQGKEDQARQALARLRGTPHVDDEMEEMKAETKTSVRLETFTLKNLVTTPALRVPLVIACLMQVAQQLSGINVVMTYSTLIFVQANVRVKDIPYMVVGTGAINVLCTIIAVPLMEKLGRRPLLLWPMFEMIVSLVALTISLKLMTKPDLKDSSPLFAVLCIIAAHTYIVGFAVGLGPIPFLVVSELFRQEPRAAAMGLSLAFNWISNFILMLLFPPMKDALGAYTYLAFCFELIVSIAFIFICVPETKNKTFDEIASSMAFGGAKKAQGSSDQREPMEEPVSEISTDVYPLNSPLSKRFQQRGQGESRL